MEFSKSPANNFKEAMTEILMLIPNFMALMYGLIKDSRVPSIEKKILAGTIAYVILPLDLMPDAIPFIGQIDDIFLVAVTLKRILTSVPESILIEYWNGEKALLGIIESIIETAVNFLPEQIRNILLRKID